MMMTVHDLTWKYLHEKTTQELEQEQARVTEEIRVKQAYLDAVEWILTERERTNG